MRKAKELDRIYDNLHKNKQPNNKTPQPNQQQKTTQDNTNTKTNEKECVQTPEVNNKPHQITETAKPQYVFYFQVSSKTLCTYSALFAFLFSVQHLNLDTMQDRQNRNGAV